MPVDAARIIYCRAETNIFFFPERPRGEREKKRGEEGKEQGRKKKTKNLVFFSNDLLPGGADFIRDAPARTQDCYLHSSLLLTIITTTTP
jgi:hypothetical protein